AAGGELLTYTLDGQNLSFDDYNNVIIEQEFDSSRQSFVSASDGGVLQPATACR
ncbi:MAG: hypothetical protein GWN79_18075, partial [Actinobacteria bacterium]|nr:hypothetical protein [Actinomycetota bacterium]NIS33979.1 hypothetical protein [Actinomycetota bacterium]NIU20862.1 hypothetical protein [Actinomycetota bacterium]NIU68785.1 hypothetical protein [Actinomycetota bacterium]NIV57370.1 hypothetical protein [Actinomycetota bacterium]